MPGVMLYRQINEALKKKLFDDSNNQYNVIGFVPQNLSADSLKNNNRLVQVYYSNGSFGVTSNGRTRPANHQMTFNIDLTVSAAVKGDFATISNPSSTTSQKKAAIANFTTAADSASTQLDELIQLCYYSLMDGVFLDILEENYEVSDRWISDIEKDKTQDRGGLVVRVARLTFTCNAAEEPGGEEGEDLQGINTSFELNNDANAETGLEVNYNGG
jgi:hypothetical protein